MDEIIVNQIRYISSKRVAKETGYARDYVGQLIRQGKLDAQRVGRSWYVSEKSLAKLKPTLAATNPPQTDFKPVERRMPVVPHLVEYSLPKTWSDIKYLPDDSSLYPISDTRVSTFNTEIANVSNTDLQAPAEIEKVRITVVQPNRVVARAVPALSAGLMGVRIPKSHVLAPQVPYKRVRGAFISAHGAGVVTGAALFLVLVSLL